MKPFRLAILSTLLAVVPCAAPAAVYTFQFSDSFANNGVVPDGNTTGWFDTRALSGIGDSQIIDVNVSLALNGGYNGDLYAYLSHSSGFTVLLNRAGRTGANAFGYSDAGLNINFDDTSANGDIHNYQLVPGYVPAISNSGVWSPDGRNVNPVLSLDSDGRTRLLDQFNGTDPNGTWTLFVADLSTGEQSTVAGWGLTITAVPEPSALALGILGIAALWVRKVCVRFKVRRLS